MKKKFDLFSKLFKHYYHRKNQLYHRKRNSFDFSLQRFSYVFRNDIGVITPYTRQVKQISERLSSSQIPKGVEVRTVDGFQGREKTIIIISLVRSNNDNEIGFLVNPQRMNVLLTRAKNAMIVFGHKRTLISNQLWKSWIDSVPNVTGQHFRNQCLIKLNSTVANQHPPRSNNGRKSLTNNCRGRRRQQK